ncbi:MAG: MATE family efflux transporter [Bacteroidaceae bacterium]|nr:MATE family efflux transporter [Bacteroidaceae bacterium]
MSGRDDIDFGTVRIPRLFRKIFIPTLLGMVSWSLLTVVDGMFVGWGVGSNGIAAINICYPIFMLLTGFALMVGMGASVVASIHLSRKNVKAARINVTQAIWFSTLAVLVAIVVVELMPERFSYLLGASPTLLPMVRDYMVYLMPSGVAQMWSIVGLFIIRLDGAPKYAMWCNVVPAVANMFLDWLFIFPLGMGVKGAAIASLISTVIGGVMAIVYLLRYADTLMLRKLKMSLTSMRLTLRNIAYQCKIGFSAFLGELTMALLMITGNYVFMEYLGNAGVAAFGVACYYLPFVFMFGNSIAESAQPIISYNYGLGNNERVQQTLSISVRTGVVSSLLSIVAFTLFPQALVHLFIAADDPAALIAIEGFPYFATGFLFFILNLIAIGYFQSIEEVVPATLFAILRGALFMIPSFLLLPQWLGSEGMWLAVPLSEALTFVVVVTYFVANRKRI